MKNPRNRFTRVLMLIMAFAWICFLIPANEVSAVETNGYENKFGYMQLKTEAQRRVYVAYVEGLSNLSEEIHFDVGLNSITLDEYYEALESIDYDHPELFYIKRGALSNAYDDKIIIFPEYKLGDTIVSVSEAAAAKTEYELAVAKVLNSIPVSAVSDYDKALYLYEYLANYITYEFNEYDQTAYGALVLGRCVCAGYAAAYQDLLNRLGIPTWMITGLANNGAVIGDHAWNVVWIDGECVYTDPTWGDLEHNGINYNYFNISKEQMSRDHFHTPDYDAYLPECNHTSHAFKKPPVAVQGISLDRYSAALYYNGESFHLGAAVNPGDADNKEVTYSSSNTNVATVGADGLVTAKGEGTAVITVTTKEGGYTASCMITVTYPHRHTLEKHAETNATCTDAGKKEFYKCSGCDKVFADADAQQQILDMSELVIPATGHTAGEWQFDDAEHWASCSVCQEVLTDTRGVHIDLDEDKLCDTCAYSIPEETTEETQPLETNTSTSDPDDDNSPTITAPESQDSTTAGDDSVNDAKVPNNESKKKTLFDLWHDMTYNNSGLTYAIAIGTAISVSLVVILAVALRRRKN